MKETSLTFYRVGKFLNKLQLLYRLHIIVVRVLWMWEDVGGDYAAGLYHPYITTTVMHEVGHLADVGRGCRTTTLQ